MRFGPEPWHGGPDGFRVDGIVARAGHLEGAAGDFRWELTERPEDGPLFTFPRWSWRRPRLPAQMLPAARASYDGTVTYGGEKLTLQGAPGASARIYGHGNARRWAWLHADLGEGDVLEIVAAVSMRPGLRRLPPLVFLRLRRGGRTWPRRAERAALGWAGLGRFRAALGRPDWSVTGRAGLRRIRVEVSLPAERTLRLDYADPDGSPARCHNSETADAVVRLERWWGRWRPEAEWLLEGTAHAEVGAMSAAALVAALLADDGSARWPARVPRRLDDVLASMPAPARAGVRGAARAVDAYALARTGRPLAALGPAERDRLMTALAARPRLAPLLDLLKVPVLLAAGTERMLDDRARARRGAGAGERCRSPSHRRAIRRWTAHRRGTGPRAAPRTRW